MSQPLQVPIQVAIDPRAFEHAGQQIGRIKETVAALTEAMNIEHEAISARDEYLAQATLALIGTPNAATNKPHSADSAEKAVKQTDEYKRLAATRIDAENARLFASAAHAAQQLHARLAVAVIEHAIPTGDYH